MKPSIFNSPVLAGFSALPRKASEISVSSESAFKKVLPALIGQRLGSFDFSKSHFDKTENKLPPPMGFEHSLTANPSQVFSGIASGEAGRST